MVAWQTILGHLSDLIFPQGCLVCDQVIASSDGFWCQKCAKRLAVELTTEYCPRCGHSAGLYVAGPNGCGQCRDHLPPYEAIVRVGLYHGLAGELVRKYKLGHQQRLDQSLATLLCAAIRGQAWCERLDALVAVPTSWTSRWRYRSNPIVHLAAPMSRDLKIPALPIMHVRGKRRRQMELPLSDRPSNVRGKFTVDRHARIEGTTLCVIDDVSTSGATLREVTRALKRAGAAQIYAAVLAKTDSGGQQTVPRPSIAVKG